MDRKVFFFFFFFLLGSLTYAATTTYTVSNTGDNGGVNPAAGAGTGTLRQAIVDANANAGHDTIKFQLTGGSTYTITLAANLPALTDNAGVTIDGFSQPGTSPNTIPVVKTSTLTPMNAVYGIIINHSTGSVFTITSNYNVIRGLALPIHKVNGIVISSGNHNTILGCYIGMDITGTLEAIASNGNGIYLNGSTGNVLDTNSIGDGTAAGANLISGNAIGVNITGGNPNKVNGITIQGNMIGLQKDGSTLVANSYQKYGILEANYASGTSIGGNLPGQGNVISGNGDGTLNSYGINVSTIFEVTVLPTIQGNIIGPQANGTIQVIGNTQAEGIYITGSGEGSGAPDILIGGSTSGALNVISANSTTGIDLETGGATIQGNYIGIAGDGMSYIAGNTQSVGVNINTDGLIAIVGGTGTGNGNVISGNGDYGAGISVTGDFPDAIIQGNIIGPQADGKTNLLNIPDTGQMIGIYINSADAYPPQTTIGGSAAGAGNIISANLYQGIYISGSNSVGNTIQGNYIGCNASGDSIAGSTPSIQWYGIYLDGGAYLNTIGGYVNSTCKNVIAYNDTGVYITGSLTNSNIITRNSIYSNNLGIDLNYGVSQGNTGKPAPVIISVSTHSISGTTSAATDSIEVFANNTGNCQDAPVFLGIVKATAGLTWNLTNLTVTAGETVTATARDVSKNTSQFSNCMFYPLTVNSATICMGSSAVLTASGAVNYTWYPSTGLSSTTGSSVTANPTANITYTVVGTIESSSNTAIATITVNPGPTLSIGGTSVICNGQSATLTASGGGAYFWSNSATTAIISITPNTTTSYSLTVINNNNCQAVLTQTITVNGLPTLITSADVFTCSGSSTTLTVTGADTYTWNPSTGLDTTVGDNVQTTLSAGTFNYTITGTYTLTGCAGTSEVTVSVQNILTLNAGPDATICQGSGTLLSATGGSDYIWIPSAGLNSPTITNPTASPTTTTTYTLTAISTCPVTNAQITIFVNPLPTVTIIPANTSLCTGSDITIAAGGAASYNWYPFIALNDSIGTAVTAFPTSSISYTITGTDNNGCTNQTTSNITVFSLPVISASENATICAGNSVVLSASGATNYNWLPVTSPPSGQTVMATPASNITYTVTGIDQNNCTNTATVQISVDSLPVVEVSGNLTINYGETAILSATSNGTTYNWQPASLVCNTCATISVSPTLTTTYYLTITGNNGCEKTDSVIVTIHIPCGEIYVPDAFSPNGDGLNDNLYPMINSSCYQTITFRIFDRWGNIVFDSQSAQWGNVRANYSWDGTYMGKMLNDDVFVYLLQITLTDGTAIIKKGNVSLVR